MVETTLRARANLEKRIRELLSLHFSAGSPINKFLLAASLQRLPAFLFGGTLRDLLVFGSLPRDLDIVVRTSNLETLTTVSPVEFQRPELAAIFVSHFDWSLTPAYAGPLPPVVSW